MKIYCALRYPGGKSKYIEKYIIKYIPYDFDIFCDPFLGGGSVPLYVKQMYPNKKFWVNDYNTKLYYFWVNLQLNGDKLINSILKIKKDYINNPEKLYLKMKDFINSDNKFEIAISYFILNHIVFAGMTEKASFSITAFKSNFTDKVIYNLIPIQRLLKNVRITNLSYEELFNEKGNIFYFLDPPYDIKYSLYGNKDGKMHKYFNHDYFYENIKKLNNRFLITYNCNENILEKYKKFNIDEVNYKYYMAFKNNKTRIKKELMIYNYDIKEASIKLF